MKVDAETGNLIELRCKFGLPSTSTPGLITIPSPHLNLIEVRLVLRVFNVLLRLVRVQDIFALTLT